MMGLNGNGRAARPRGAPLGLRKRPPRRSPTELTAGAPLRLTNRREHRRRGTGTPKTPFDGTLLAATLGAGGDTWSDAVSGVRSRLPELSACGAPGHELVLANRIRSVANNRSASDEEREDVVRCAFQILIVLCIRDDAQRPAYRPFMLPQNYLAPYPINLESLRHHAAEKWSNLSVSEMLAWLGTHWGVGTHIRVALRKLRQQGNDTFRVRPTEQGLVVSPSSATVVPTYGSPRFQQAAQILWDLGALAWHPDRRGFSRTAFGDDLARNIHG